MISGSSEDGSILLGNHTKTGSKVTDEHINTEAQNVCIESNGFTAPS